MTKATLFQFLFSPKGRIPRYLFWRFILLANLSLILYYLTLGQANHIGIISNIWVILFLLYAYAASLLIPAIIICIKRLHDIDQSGWWVLLFFVPYIDILGIIILLVLGIKKGTTGDNKYGHDPLNKDSSIDIKEENTLTNNASPTNNADISPYIKSSFSPLDRARKK